MPSIFTPTIPTFLSDPIPYTAASSGANSGSSPYILDLKTKFGAWIWARLGRNTASSPTISSYIAIRSTDNLAINHPGQAYDRVGGLATAAQTTLSGSASIGSTTLSFTSASGFSVGDNICVSNGSTNVEFLRIAAISGSTVFPEFPTLVAHTSGDAAACKENNYPLLEIPYTEFDNIENLIENFLFEIK